MTTTLNADAPQGIRLASISKTYDGEVDAVRDVSLDIAAGEFVVLVGPSGCGKSTLLRMVAGLESVTRGTISIDGRDVTHLAPRVRDIAMVFQNYALYPQMTVGENLEFGLRMRKTDRQERARRVSEVATALGLTELLKRRPSQLSGGQRQRVAMGRAMVREPAAFLMDEPLSNLDAKLRVSMRSELSRLHDRVGVTTVYVTHDQVEAMTLGQRVAVLRDGVLQQCDRPQTLFDEPVNLFVAAFIGSPTMNLVEATVQRGVARFAGCELVLGARAPRDGNVILGVRPDDIHLATGEGTTTVSARADVVEELGAESLVGFALDAPPVTAEAVTAARDGDADDRLLLDDNRAQWMARIPGRRGILPGTQVALSVDASHVHVFDVGSGAAIEAP